MGHTGAITSGGKGTVIEKLAILRECGLSVADSPAGDVAGAAEDLQAVNYSLKVGF